jgi:hypothetical protein
MSLTSSPMKLQKTLPLPLLQIMAPELKAVFIVFSHYKSIGFHITPARERSSFESKAFMVYIYFSSCAV